MGPTLASSAFDLTTQPRSPQLLCEADKKEAIRIVPIQFTFKDLLSPKATFQTPGRTISQCLLEDGVRVKREQSRTLLILAMKDVQMSFVPGTRLGGFVSALPPPPNRRSILAK